MKKSLCRGLIAFTSLAALASCQDYEGGFNLDQIKKASYAKDFEKTFGTPDPNQDWSMATLVKANVNLPGLSGTAKMNICTGDPRNAETRLLAQIMLKDGQGSIDFDAIKGVDNVFVTVEQDGQYKVFSQYNIVNGLLGIGDVQMPMTRVGVGNVSEVSSFSSTCPTTQRTGTTATVDYTYFNNIVSTTEIDGIKYPKTDSYTNSNNMKTLEGWIVWAKSNITWDSWNKILTNNSPFTDETVCQFIKVSGSDFSSCTESNMKSTVTTSQQTESLITWNGSKMNFDGWKQSVIDGNNPPSNYQYNNSAWPFETSSILFYNSATYQWFFDWSNPQYKQNAVVIFPGTVYNYNGQSLSLSAWQTDAINHIGDIISGSYDGPWENDLLLSCITFVPCNRTDDGAIFSLTNESTWVLKDNAESHYANVYPTFQYLDKVEQSSSPAITLGDFNSFFGDGNFFAESVSVWADTKLGKYYDEATMRKMENGFSIVTTEKQVIELPYVFGCTAYSNQFGYIYYKAADEDKIDPITLKHYVLIEDGRPSQNVYRDSWKGTAVSSNGNNYAADKYYTYSFTDENGNPTFSGNYVTLEGAKDDPFVCTCNEQGGTGIYSAEHKHLSTCYSPADRYAQIAAKSFYGTTYRPMFFGEDGKASQGTYEWPAGYKIVFWINTLAESDQPEMLKTHPAARFTSDGNMGGHFNYSLPTINKRLFHNYQGSLSHTAEELKTLGQVQCISWTLDGTTFLAFGDVCGDKDLNDMVFMVSAPNSDPGNTVVTVPVKWHLNYNAIHENNDLFDNYTLNQGASYTNPKNSDGDNSEPSRVGYEFVGWSTNPAATAGDKTITSTVPTTSTDAIHYYAVWQPIGDEPIIENVTIRWHYNYNGIDGGHGSDGDVYETNIVTKSTGKYSKPTTNPTNTADQTKVFKGWALSPDATEVIDPATLVDVTAGDKDICYYAIWEGVPDITPDPEWISWIFACEDLGGSFDYDFNDVVWEVKYAAGATTAQVKLLAAGGTLPFTLSYNGTPITTKAAEYASTAEVYISQEGSLDYHEFTVPSTWSVEANKHLFTVAVDVEGTGASTIISAYQKDATKSNKSPQVLLLPGGWQWPAETQNIGDKYPSFKNWVAGNGDFDWSKVK